MIEVGREYVGRGFQITVKENQILMQVDPEKTAVQPLAIDEIKVFFARQGWPWMSEPQIKAILERNDGHPQAIVIDLATIKTDARLRIRVTDDRMRAFARVTPACWGKALTVADVQRQLSEHAIRYGVEQDVIEQMVAAQGREQEWLVASGTPAQNGNNARLEYTDAVRNSGGKPSFLPDGRVDFREINNIMVVTEGQVLATKLPPTAGIPGRDVCGNELPAAPGRDLIWPVGKGVHVDNDRLLASIAGQVVFKAGRINVLSVYDIPNDVDYSVGNVRFNGNIQIHGSVKPGFTLQAEGDIRISGGVDSANIICGGTLTVRAGIQGQGRGKATVEGDIFSRFIENCSVSAGGAIVVGEDIMHSQVSAGRSIQVGGRKGLIVGGVVRATDSIECKVLGASLGTPTSLEVGINPAVFEQFGQLQVAISKLEDELTRLKQGIDRLVQLREAAGSLPSARQEMLNQLQRAYNQRTQELNDMVWQLSQQEQAMAAIKGAFIKVTDTIYPGTKITIGKSVYYTRERKRGGIFRLHEGDVAFTAL